MLSLPDPCDTKFLEGVLGPRSHRGKERRQFERQALAKNVALVPLNLDGPDFARGMKVETEDISRGGAAIVTERPPLGPHWALALDVDPKRAVIMEVAIRDLRRREDGKFRVACQFLKRINQAA